MQVHELHGRIILFHLKALISLVNITDLLTASVPWPVRQGQYIKSCFFCLIYLWRQAPPSTILCGTGHYLRSSADGGRGILRTETHTAAEVEVSLIWGSNPNSSRRWIFRSNTTRKCKFQNILWRDLHYWYPEIRLFLGKT